MQFTDPEFMKLQVYRLMDAYNDAQLKAAILLWKMLLNILAQHWPIILMLLCVIFLILAAKAYFGRWGSLGIYLYNVIYFGTCFFIALLFGPGVFFKDIFSLFCAVILYPVCYSLTGLVLKKMGVRQRYAN